MTSSIILKIMFLVGVVFQEGNTTTTPKQTQTATTWYCLVSSHLHREKRWRVSHHIKCLVSCFSCFNFVSVTYMWSYCNDYDCFVACPSVTAALVYAIMVCNSTNTDCLFVCCDSNAVWSFIRLGSICLNTGGDCWTDGLHVPDKEGLHCALWLVSAVRSAVFL